MPRSTGITNFGFPLTESQTRTSPPSWPSQLPWAEARHFPSGENRGNQISRTTLSSARASDGMTDRQTTRATAIDERRRRAMIWLRELEGDGDNRQRDPRRG